MKRITVYFIILASILFIARFNNPPDGRTGAPGDSSCNSGGCHNTAGATHTANVAISGFPSSLDGGQTYTINLTASHGGTLPSSPRMGFQLVVLDENNENIGTLSNPTPSATITSSGTRTYAEHNPGLNSSNTTWTVDFTAPPSSASQMVTVYAAVNVANGNGNSSGDLIREVTMSANLSATNDPLSASIIKIRDVSCNQGNDGSAEVNASGGATMNYDYEWDNGEVTRIATNLTAGLHTVSVTDNTETVVESVIIDQPDELFLTLVEKSNPSCHNVMNGRIEVNAQGGTSPYSYRWSNGDNGNVLRNVFGDTYTCTVTDINNCEATLTETLATPDPITLNFETTPPRCHNSQDGSILVSSSGGTGEINYNWSTGDETSSLTALNGGMYYVTAMDDNGCLKEDSVLLESPDPLIHDWQIQEILCFGDSTGAITVDVQGGTPSYEYLWSNDSTTSDISGLPSGTYSLTVQDINGCNLVIDTFIAQPDELIVNPVVNQPDCPNDQDGTIDLQTSGGVYPYMFSWNTGQSDSIIAGIGGGTYIFTVTDANGCEYIDSIMVNLPALIEYDLSSINESRVMGNDGSASVDNIIGGTAPYDLKWSTGSTSNQISMLAPDVYYLSITDSQNCIVIDSVEVEKYQCTLSLDYEIKQPLCANSCDGALIFTNIEGVEPLNYAFSFDPEDQESLCAGNYGVTVEDAAGCVDSFRFELIDPSPIVIQIDSIRIAADDVVNSGAIYTTAIGGTGTLTGMLLLNGTDSVGTSDLFFDFIGIPAGNYTVLFTDENGCTKESIQIEVPIETNNNEQIFSNVIFYPQPANEMIYISGIQELDVQHIRLYNGEMKPFTLPYSSDGSRFKLDLQSVNSGLYIVEIELKNGQKILRKMIKQ